MVSRRSLAEGRRRGCVVAVVLGPPRPGRPCGWVVLTMGSAAFLTVVKRAFFSGLHSFKLANSGHLFSRLRSTVKPTFHVLLTVVVLMFF